MYEFVRKRPDQRKVVVTGLSIISPIGNDLKTAWDNAVNGKPGVGTISSFDTSNTAVKIAGEVKGFDPLQFIEKKELKKMDRFVQMSIACSDMAIKDSGLDLSGDLGNEIGAYIGVGIGGLPYIEAQHKTFLEKGPRRLSPFFIPSVITNMASGLVSIRHGLKGPNFSITSACASGSHSIGEAAELIRRGQAKAMIAGGAESCVCPMAINGFAAMKALSTNNDNPEQASRPWDDDRDGFVLAEGAALLVLEDYEHAAQRGAKIYGEVKGYGASSDAYHITTPSPAGAASAINAAIKDAEINVEDIEYVNAHGTSTPAGDPNESMVLEDVFGASAKNLWVSSTKSMTGHGLGAAGAMESVFSLMALNTGVVPPTINLDKPSENCILDYVPKVAREKNLTHVLNNSFGFGGTNSCLIFGKV